MSKGGARPGSGPKKGSKHKKTIEAAAARDALTRIYLEKWEEIARTALQLGLGELQVLDNKGKFMRIYTKAPDGKMLQDIIETIIGKARQEISGGINLPQLDQLANDIRIILSKK